jgi:hypothetical protein
MRHRVSPECGVFTRVLPRIRPHHCIQFKAVYDETEDIKSPSLYLYLYNHNLRLHFNTIINITNKELSILLIHVSTDTRTLQIMWWTKVGPTNVSWKSILYRYPRSRY